MPALARSRLIASATHPKLPFGDPVPSPAINMQTQAGWAVSDVRAEVAELRSRSVKVEDYDMPGLKTEDGIADIGFAWMAWIIDPGKNALAIMQVKQ